MASGECPNKECRDRLDDVRRFVYGDGPGTGLFDKCCQEVEKMGLKIENIKRCISTRAWKFIFSFGAALVLGGYGLYYQTQSNADWIEQQRQTIAVCSSKIESNSKACSANNTNIQLMRKDIVNINKNIEDIKHTLNEMNRKLQHD